MDLMALAGNLFNVGNMQQNGLQNWQQQIAAGVTPDASASFIDPAMFQMIGQGIDPNAVVPGLGLGAEGQPGAPPREAYQEIQRLTETHKVTQENRVKDFEADIEDRKDAFYESHSLEFRNGQPVRNDDGTLKISNDPETRAQRQERRDWEREQKRTLREAHEARKNDFYRDAQLQAQQDAAANGNNSNSPEGRASAQRLMRELEAQEMQMLNEQRREIFSVGTPPQLMGQVDRGLAEIAALKERHSEELATHPAQQQIDAYQAEMTAFLANQHARLQQHQQQDGQNWAPPDLQQMQAGMNGDQQV